jgi:ribosome-associated protein
VGPVLAIVDWFVLASAGNPRQARTIAEEVEEQLRRHDGSGPLRVEGADDARWILLDFGDIAVHVFLDEARSFYDLDRLWADVARLDWSDGLSEQGSRAAALPGP